MNDETGKIKITLEDVERVQRVQELQPQAAPPGYAGPPQPPTGPKNYGRLSTANEAPAVTGTGHGPIHMQAWFYLGAAGLAGAFLAWALCEPAFVDGQGQERWGNSLIFPFMVIFMSLGFGVAESIVERSIEKVALRGVLSLLIGAPLGFGFYFVANVVFGIGLAVVRELGVSSAENPVVWFTRAIAWVVFGIAGGVVYGLVGQSFKKCLYGVVGGMVGAGIGGLVFDPISLVLGTAVLSRAFGMMIFGASTGAAMGLIESALKSRWLFVTAGPLAGKQFILYKPVTTMGSRQGGDIYLFKDPSIVPEHATIEQRGNRLWLRATGTVFTNGRPEQQCCLAPGDLVQIGRYSFTYQEKAK
jgi:hypothetical protein